MTISDFHIAFKLELDKTNSLSYPSFEPEEIDYWLNNAIRKFVKTRAYGTNPKRLAFQQDQKRSDDLRSTFTDMVKVLTSNDLVDINTYIVQYPTDYWFGLGENVDITFNDALDISHTYTYDVTEATIDNYNSKLENSLSEYRLNNNKAKPIRFYNSDNTICLITDGNYTLSAYYLTYIKKPLVIDWYNPFKLLSTLVPNKQYAKGSIIWGTSGNLIKYYMTTIDNQSFANMQEVVDAVASNLVLDIPYTTVTSLTEYTYLPEHTHDEVIKLAVQMALENISDQRYQTYSSEVATME